VGWEPGDVVAPEPNAPAVGPVETGEEVEEGRFPGAVGADEPGDRPLAHLERTAVDRAQAAERLGQIFAARKEAM
jgi:hypothetical protein